MELVEVLIKEAFQSMREEIKEVKKENLQLKEEIKALKEKDKDFVEVHNLFDKKIVEIIGYIKEYVAKDSEKEDFMKEYKLGE